MTRLEAGALDLRRDWVDLREVIDRLVALSRKRGATQRFAVRCDPHLPLVFADQTLLDQALGNVLANAIRLTVPYGTIEIAAEKGKETVVISIIDDGPGIAPDILPHIFDKFSPKAGMAAIL